MIMNRLSTLMGARRLTMLDVARMSGLNYRTVRELYHARARRIDFETLDKLCAALEVGVGDLLEHQPSTTD
jgi:putative transcriptional regulator